MFLKFFENEKSLRHFPHHVVLIRGSSNHLIKSTKHLKNDQKIFTHNLPLVLSTTRLYPQSGVNPFLFKNRTLMECSGLEPWVCRLIDWVMMRSQSGSPTLVSGRSILINLFCGHYKLAYFSVFRRWNVQQGGKNLVASKLQRSFRSFGHCHRQPGVAGDTRHQRQRCLPATGCTLRAALRWGVFNDGRMENFWFIKVPKIKI